MRINEKSVLFCFQKWIEADVDSTIDSIQYWRNMSQYVISTSKTESVSFADLSKLAISLLSIPATEAVVERVFSALGNIHTAQRSTLKSDILDAILNIKVDIEIN